jgi:hypothetical protein
LDPAGEQCHPAKGGTVTIEQDLTNPSRWVWEHSALWRVETLTHHGLSGKERLWIITKTASLIIDDDEKTVVGREGKAMLKFIKQTQEQTVTHE